MPTKFPDICSSTIGNCFLRITIDTRHEKPGKKVPVCLSSFISGKVNYYRLGYYYSRSEYIDICNSTGKGRQQKNAPYRPFDVKQDLIAKFNDLLHKLRDRQPLTDEKIKIALTGVGVGGNDFLSFWEKCCEQKQTGTANSYLVALRSFKRHVKTISGFNITVDHIKMWESAMMEAGNSQTTIGIYLRSFRAIWHMAEAQQLVSAKDYPFGKKEKGLISIPRGSTRKKDYLSTDQMTELFRIFLRKSYPVSWKQASVASKHKLLGMFLATYLCNGFNLADAANLVYDDFYFANEKKAFRFVRQKTELRSSQEVIIPIIAPLQRILDEIGAQPSKGSYVFPQILEGETTPERCASRVKSYNGYIKKAVREICKVHGLEIQVGTSWCRHAFATNLTNAGVPRDYISEAMGHSYGGSNAVTGLYIDNYPLSTQMEFNNMLLNLTEGEAIASSPAKKMVSLSDEEYAAFLEFQRTRK